MQYTLFALNILYLHMSFFIKIVCYFGKIIMPGGNVYGEQFKVHHLNALLSVGLKQSLSAVCRQYEGARLASDSGQ